MRTAARSFRTLTATREVGESPEPTVIQFMLVLPLIAIVAACALWPIWREWRARAAVASAGLVGIALLVTVLGAWTQLPAPAPAPVDRPLETGGHGGAFASSRACRACHPSQ